ncbi:MAG: hypothetical protein ACLFOY_10965 [Desulfatibacillaceae bacterium]
MAGIIDEKTVNQVVLPAGHPQATRDHVAELHEKQPHLLDFLWTMYHKVQPEVGELMIFICLAVYRMFRTATGASIPMAGPDDLARSVSDNNDRVQSLDSATRASLLAANPDLKARQPHVLGFVVDSLCETSTEEDPVPLREDEKAFLFLTAATVCDVLDRMG